ncbi:SDR family oxidoreductase [Antrihabitans sp. YC2-6]|uniref:SDR family NAD(P)-dependent oxidoreductase n=1 Tax=Antrihabitans sp. YC2-6 TaxID=2799498 RepID=UPI0018F3F4E7|nr:SDR family oxidoreductase [Antrihabitans sp. YC2-6]MBJ8348301.1 SDR family oxidoreductase [Antrihabitans sp. YC2-6]
MTKSALVTGASRGIGLGVAKRLAHMGYSLTVTARDPERLETVAQDLAADGTAVRAIAGDLSDPEHLVRLTEEHEKRHGSMTALILNAGVGTAGNIADFPLRRFDKTFAVNVRAPFQLLQQSLPLLRAGATENPDRGAKVVSLASITGVYAERGLAVYGATKAALISLTQTLNAEESGRGISATTIAPGYVDTDMSKWTQDTIPPNEMLEVNDIVEMVAAILQLSSRAVIPNIVMTRAGTDGYGA